MVIVLTLRQFDIVLAEKVGRVVVDGMAVMGVMAVMKAVGCSW